MQVVLYSPIEKQTTSIFVLSLGQTEAVMKKQIKKENLPQKICKTCLRPFSWRKKWERVWEDVLYCSDKCRMNKNKSTHEK